MVGETLRVELDKGADGQTAFKRQRGKDYVGDTACFGEAICYRIPLRIQTKMELRWEADGVFLGRLDLSDEVIVGTPNRIKTTRSFRRMTEDRQWNPDTPAHVCWSTVETAWHHHRRTWRNSQTLHHESSSANTWSNRRMHCLSRTSPCAKVSETV